MRILRSAGQKEVWWRVGSRALSNSYVDGWIHHGYHDQARANNFIEPRAFCEFMWVCEPRWRNHNFM